MLSTRLTIRRTARSGSRRLLVLSVAVACASVTVACGGGANAGSGSSDSNEVEVGLIREQTGSLQEPAVALENAVALAVHQVNAAGGFTVKGKKYTLKLVQADDRSDPGQTAALANRFVRDEQIKFIFGGESTLGPVVLKVTDPAKSIFFSPSSAAASFAGTPQGQYLFTTIPGLPARVASAVSGALAYRPGLKTVVVAGAASDQQQVLLPRLAKAFQDKGVQVLDRITWDPSTTDFAGLVHRLSQKHPQMVALGATDTPTLAALIKANNSLNEVPIWDGWGNSCDSAVAAKTTTPFIGFPAVPTDLVHANTPVIKQFVKDYEDFTGGPGGPTFDSATWYFDFVGVLVKAMEQAGTVSDTDAIRKELRSLNYEGKLISDLHFDPTQAVVYPMESCYIENANTPQTEKSY